MCLPTSLYSLLLVIAASGRLAAAEPALTDNASCDCFRTNGSIVGFFAQHRFFDFRNLSQYAGVPDAINDKNESANAFATSDYFLSDQWNNFWEIQSWNNSGGERSDATIYMGNSPNNIYIEQNTDDKPSSKTWMTLRTMRLPTFQTAAEIESVSRDFKFLSVRMLARTVGSPGGCTAMFTYRGRGSSVQEADVEVRTIDPPTVVQYTNQPSVNDDGDVIAQATINATLPGGLKWSDWAVHRLDWTPTQSTWYVDGVQSAKISYQVPRDPSQVILNAWSNGGAWTGNMTKDHGAYMQIQWFDIVYNSTGDGGGEQKRAADKTSCRRVCSVDDTSRTGTPVLLWNAAPRLGQGTSGLMVWVPYLAGLAMVYMSSGLLA